MPRLSVVKFQFDDRAFAYPAKFARDKTDGGYVVTFRDVPEAITQGDSIEECYREGEGALQAAIEARIADRMEIPKPSKAKKGERVIYLPMRTALKAAVHLGMLKTRITNVDLAKRMGLHEREVRRMLDPKHPTKSDRLEQALVALGKKVEVRIH